MFSQYPAPAARTGKHSSATILSEAYGIISFTPITGKQIVKVYKTDGIVDNTSCGYTNNPAEVKDEGSYKVTKWVTSKNKTKATSNKADFPDVCAGCELKQSGSSPATVTMTAEESAIFILLERKKEEIPIVLDKDSIRAHELQQGNQGAVSEGIETT